MPIPKAGVIRELWCSFVFAVLALGCEEGTTGLRKGGSTTTTGGAQTTGAASGTGAATGTGTATGTSTGVGTGTASGGGAQTSGATTGGSQSSAGTTSGSGGSGAGGSGAGGSGAGGAAGGGSITFPVVVDRFFYASGYIGDGAQAGSIVESSTCPTRAGDKMGSCHQFTWKPGAAGWASVFWQYPPNNWTHLPGRPIPAGATQLSFYAWSDAGGESITFGAGQAGADTFQISAPAVILNATPTRYVIPLADIRYGTSVVGGFVWAASFARAGGIKFYVDDIQWQNTPVPDPEDGWPAGPRASGISLRVRNKCSFPLWIKGSGQEATLAPATAQIASGAIQNYDVPKQWTAARVNAYMGAADAEPIEKAEMTFHVDADGTNHVGYNVTYVDSIGLPLEIRGYGGSCNIASHRTGCFATRAAVASGCPESFLVAGSRCQSARSYCLASSAPAYCNALSGAISACSQCPAATTTEVYACSGPYANEPRLCAALNRGMTSDPDNPNGNLFYKTAPYNTYAKWIHQICPGIYAFSYDDWLSQGGFRDCAGGTEVRLTFCPSG